MLRTLGGLKDTFTSLMESAQKMGLEIIQEKTLYMYSGKDGNKPNSISVGEYKFQRVDRFKYVGSMIDEETEEQLKLKASDARYKTLLWLYEATKIQNNK